MLIHTGPSTTVRPLLYMLSSSILILTSGLEALIKLVTKWRKEPTTYSPTEMTAALDMLKPVLFEHLDQEARILHITVIFHSDPSPLGAGSQGRPAKASFHPQGDRGFK